MPTLTMWTCPVHFDSPFFLDWFVSLTSISRVSFSKRSSPIDFAIPALGLWIASWPWLGDSPMHNMWEGGSHHIRCLQTGNHISSLVMFPQTSKRCQYTAAQSCDMDWPHVRSSPWVLAFIKKMSRSTAGLKVTKGFDMHAFASIVNIWAISVARQKMEIAMQTAKW